MKQLFAGTFTNQQVFAASCTALAVSVFGLWRLKMTGFAWTTATLGAASYISLLLLFNWLDKKPEIQALWCLPLAALEPVALALERRGRVRWTLPFHLVALLALVVGLDVIALNGPTLEMLGVTKERWPFFDEERLKAFSFVLNGLLFLLLMLFTERSRSLDLRRASKLLEVLAIVHTLSALFINAMDHRNDAARAGGRVVVSRGGGGVHGAGAVPFALAAAGRRPGGLRLGKLPARGTRHRGPQDVHHRPGFRRPAGRARHVRLCAAAGAGEKKLMEISNIEFVSGVAASRQSAANVSFLRRLKILWWKFDGGFLPKPATRF